ncbi:MAG: hypothetical protein ACRDSN_14115, partial [Pseudonocardiaceae bacterium]
MSVEELLARHQCDGQVPGPSGHRQDPVLFPTAPPSDTTDTGQMFVTELLRREGRVEEQPPPPRPTGMYRLVAIVAGFVLLFGAVTASTVALSAPRTERATPSSTIPSAIAGAEALHPDLINKSVGSPPPAAPQPTAVSSQEPASSTATPNVPTTDEPAQPAPEPSRTALVQGDLQPPSTAAPEPPTTLDEDPPRGILDPDLDPVLRTVTTFYETVVVAPQQAFGLLDPQMQGSGYQDFRTAWAGVERVTVDQIRRDGPNAVLVTASLERTDGSVLHTLERVLVTS